MRGWVAACTFLFLTLLTAPVSADADFHDISPGPRTIPYFPAAAASSSGVSTSTSSALGFTYSSSVLAQLAGSAAVIGAGFLLNDSVHPGGGEDTAVDKIGEVAGSPITLCGGTVLFGLQGVRTHDEDLKENAKHMAFALAASYGTIGAFKLTIHEERPDGSDNQSFPSGHAAGSFAVASVLDREYGGATGWVAYGMATFIAASRIYGNHHQLRDVVVGAVIGHFYGWLFTR